MIPVVVDFLKTFSPIKGGQLGRKVNSFLIAKKHFLVFGNQFPMAKEDFQEFGNRFLMSETHFREFEYRFLPHKKGFEKTFPVFF